MSPLGQRFARVHRPMFPLAEVLLVVEEETVLAVSELLEKGG